MTDRRLFRVGMLLPSSNTVVEDYWHMHALRDGPLRLHFGRISVTHIGPDETSLLQFETDRMLAAFDLLAEAQPDRLVWGGTAAGWLGFDIDRTLCDQIEVRTGIPATSSLLAMNEALARCNARKIGLVTPYGAEIEARIIANYSAAGIAVVAAERLNLTINTDYAKVPPDRIGQMAQAAARNCAEAIVILCTNVGGASIVEAAGAATGLPILDSVAESFIPLQQLAEGQRPA